jgi:hypothetical protein
MHGSITSFKPANQKNPSVVTESIAGYLADRNLAPVPYQWRAQGTDILAKIQRAREKQAAKLNQT